MITNGRVITGRGITYENGLVDIRNGRIRYVGPSAGYQIPFDAEVINAGGQTIMPGVINAHVHNTGGTSSSSTSGLNLRRAFLLDGVTTTCNVGHPMSQMGSFETSLTPSGDPVGRAFNSGPQITRQDGYPAPDYGYDLIFPIESSAEAIAAVRLMEAQGADYVKISIEPDFDPNSEPVSPNLLTITQLNAIVAEAHLLGITVRAHVTDSTYIDMVLNAGVDSIEHTPRFEAVDLESATEFANLFNLLSNEAISMRTTVRRMASDDAVLVPTLVSMNKLVPWTRVRLGQTVSVYEEIVGFYAANGGAVALGTNYPQDPRVGMPIEEIQALVRTGMTNEQIVAAATYNAAWACGQQIELGSLEVSKIGDVIIVNGNPLTNPGSLADVTTVILGGEVVVSP